MDQPEPRIQLRAHPPERGRRSESITLACGCSSCCCCCCLHTVGGVVGAAIGGVLAPPADKTAAAASSTVTTAYWITFAIVGVGGLATFVTATMMDGNLDEEVLLLVLAVGLFCLPVAQAVASFVALIVAATRPSEHKGAALRRFALITGLSLAGVAAGLALMGALGGVLGALS